MWKLARVKSTQGKCDQTQCQHICMYMYLMILRVMRVYVYIHLPARVLQLKSFKNWYFALKDDTKTRIHYYLTLGAEHYNFTSSPEME